MGEQFDPSAQLHSIENLLLRPQTGDVELVRELDDVRRFHVLRLRGPPARAEFLKACTDLVTSGPSSIGVYLHRDALEDGQVPQRYLRRNVHRIHLEQVERHRIVSLLRSALK